MLASELRYRRLFETAQDGILILDAQTSQIDDANPFFLNLLGYTLEEVQGLKLWDVGAFRQVAQSKGLFLDLQEKGYVRYESLPLETKTGELIEVEFVSNVYDVQGSKVIQCNIRNVSERKAAEKQQRRYQEQLQLMLMNMVEVATSISEMRDPYTSGHERRVGQIASAIGAELGFDEARQEGLRIAGYLHDIGKMGIPVEILSKPGIISPVEHLLIQAHAQNGYNVLHPLQWPWPVAEVALQHHERMDGSGYPQGLKGDAILIEARIMAVADVTEAMTSHRPYRAGLGIEAALSEIEHGRGTLFDPVVVDACLHLFRQRAFVIPQ